MNKLFYTSFVSFAVFGLLSFSQQEGNGGLFNDDLNSWKAVIIITVLSFPFAYIYASMMEFIDEY